MMSEPMQETTETQPEDRFNRTIAIFMAVVALIIAILSYLQSDAGNRDDQANRDTKNYSVQAMGRKISGDARVNYDYNSAYQSFYEMNLLAENAEAAGESAGAERYRAVMAEMAELSPLLQEPYFNAETGELNLAQYEADTYLVEVTTLTEKFEAASKVKDAWDTKANTYIIHLTLLAVALFLFGMATTISGSLTRWIYSGAGLAVTLVAVVWAGATYAQPVPDLRDCKTASGVTAIDAYAQAVGLSYQDRYEEAIALLDEAVACDAGYANALIARGDAKMALDDLAGAAQDYELAQKAGNKSANLAGSLAWTYYLDGRFSEAVAMNQTALETAPDELWIRFDLALAHLANGSFELAAAEYQAGMDSAAAQVAQARQNNQEPPSDLWWSLDDAAISLDGLTSTLEQGEGSPTPVSIQQPDEVRAAAAEHIRALKSLAVALEYTGTAPQAALTAEVSEFVFAEPLMDEDGEVVEWSASDVFAYGLDEISIGFDYSGMQDGQDVVFKVYIDGEEDPSWRSAEPWDLGESGSAEKLLSYAFSNTKVLSAGEYTVEMYVDNQLAQRGTFWIVEE